jgi:uncharacterized protein (DUF2062 family)
MGGETLSGYSKAFMPKKYIKRFMPDHARIRNHKTLNRVFGTLLHEPNLFHLNRRSVTGAFFVGLFLAFVPLPIQMLLAAGFAILLRINMPITIGLVWITNPVTLGPIFFFCYKVGTWILGTPLQKIHFELSWAWLQTELIAIWPPFLQGCLVVGLAAAITGSVTIRLLWRLHLVRHIKARRQGRREREILKVNSQDNIK